MPGKVHQENIKNAIGCLADSDFISSKRRYTPTTHIGTKFSMKLIARFQQASQGVISLIICKERRELFLHRQGLKR